MVLAVKNQPANAGDIRDVGSTPASGSSPGRGMVTHSSIPASRIPWAKDLEDYSPQCLKKLDMTEVT